MAEQVSILDNGKMTYSFEWTINGKRVIETVSLDIANGNFGKTIGMQEKQWNGIFNKHVHISPESELGKAILNKEDGGARYTAHSNSFDRISSLASRQKNKSYEDFENAMKESGMYDIVFLNRPLPYEIPIQPVSNVATITTEDDDQNLDVTTTKVDKGTPWKGKVLTYPKGAYYNSTVGPSQDYMKIDMFKYKAPQEDYLTFQEKETGEQGINLRSGGEGDTSFAKTITGGLQTNSRTKEYLGTTKLPIPNLLGADNGVSWGTASANAFEAAAFMSGYNALGSLATGKTNFGDLFKGITGATGDIAKQLQAKGGDAAQLISAQATKMALQQLNINTDTKQFITRAQGKAVNPNLETLFSAPKIRSFSFTFEFLPQNVEDASVIRQIMRFFKQGMLPARGSSGGAPGDLFLLSPNVFRLSYMNGKNRIRSLNTFKMCALTGCRVNYTPGGTWSAYDDPNAWSQPTASTMDLSFSELTPIFADDYELSDTNKERLKDQIEEQGPLQEWFNEEDIGF